MKKSILPLLLLLACKNTQGDAEKEARKAFGPNALFQCEKVREGWACEDLCTHLVLLCPSTSDESWSCYYRQDIKLVMPAVSCPKAERRERR